MSPTKLAPGQASPEGTKQRADEGTMGPSFSRSTDGLSLSSLGMGSYLGETDPKARQAYQRSAARALEQGITLLDTASNYRHQASERDLGQALAEVDREGVFVTTKGGFLHGDVDAEMSMQAFLQERYIEPGILAPTDIVARSHAMTPAFLRHELDRSRENLGLDTIDLYLVHNPETQLSAGVRQDAFEERIRAAFVELERQRADGTLAGYGVATWDAFRAPPQADGHLSIERLLAIAGDAAAEVGHAEHGFRGVQLPFNLAMPEAAAAATQPWQGEQLPALAVCERTGLIALVSASLMQGRLFGNVPDEVKQAFGVEGDLAAALEFARSARGVTTALVGMGTPSHVEENLEALREREPQPSVVDDLLAG